MSVTRSVNNSNHTPAETGSDVPAIEMQQAFPGPEKTPSLAAIFQDDSERSGEIEATDVLPENIVPTPPKRKKSARTRNSGRDIRTLTTGNNSQHVVKNTDEPKKTDDVEVAKIAPLSDENKARVRHVARHLESYLARLDSLKRQTAIEALSAHINAGKIESLRREIADKKYNLELLFRIYSIAYFAAEDAVTIHENQSSSIVTPIGPVRFNENITTDSGKQSLRTKAERLTEYTDIVIADISKNLDAMQAQSRSDLATQKHAFFTTSRTQLPKIEELICQGDTYEARYQDAIQKIGGYFQSPPNYSSGSISTTGPIKHTPQCNVRVIPMEVTIKEKQFFTGAPMIVKTATLQINEHNSCRSEFFIQDMAGFNKVKRERKGFTSIPGLATLEWAANNVNSFRAKMPNPHEPINIDTRKMPNDVTEAFIMYCTFKGYKFRAPEGFSVSDKQMELFAAKWAAHEAADKSAKEDLALETVTAFPSPAKS